MSRRRWVLIGAAAGVVVIAAGAGIWFAATRSPTPQEAALGYLRALESGDPSAVEDTGVDASPTALSAFAHASAHIEDAEVTSVSEADGGPGQRMTAEISFRLGGDEHAAALTLVPASGRWTVDASGMGAVTATATIGSFVTIGDQTVPVGEETLLLPAAYGVTAAPSRLLDGQGTVVALPGGSAEVDVESALRPEATAAAQTTLDAQLAACTEPAEAMPEGCGIRIPWGTEFRSVSEIRYRVEQLPVLTLSVDGFDAVGGELVATVSGTGQDGAERRTTYRTTSWSVRGDVSFTDDDLVLHAW